MWVLPESVTTPHWRKVASPMPWALERGRGKMGSGVVKVVSESDSESDSESESEGEGEGESKSESKSEGRVKLMWEKYIIDHITHTQN